VGDENGTGTALAVLIARQVEGAVVWLTDPNSLNPAIFNRLGWYPVNLYQVDMVAAGLEAVRGLDLSGEAALIVLDSLAGLRGTHPQARTIANDVNRGIAGWEPQTPVLVVNQQRDPAPPGGVRWRRRANSRTLIPLLDRPIISLFQEHVAGVPPWFLVWYPKYRPEFRPLRRREWRLFFPDGLPGYQVSWPEDGSMALAPIGLKERVRPWLVDRKA
jgi:hypothetical protein